VADNLRVKEVAVAPVGDGDDGVRSQRFVVCHNPAQAERDAAVRANLIEHLRGLIEGSDAWSARRRDEFVGSLKGKPGLRRYLRRTPAGLLRIDAGAVTAEAPLATPARIRAGQAPFSRARVPIRCGTPAWRRPADAAGWPSCGMSPG
jgi:hypothetical protein